MFITRHRQGSRMRTVVWLASRCFMAVSRLAGWLTHNISLHAVRATLSRAHPLLVPRP